MAEEDQKSEEAQMEAQAQPLRPRRKRRLRHHLIDSAFPVVFGVIGVGTFVLLQHRNEVTNDGIFNYLKSKGVDSSVDIEEINSDHVKFRSLTLAKNGQKTIDIKNGEIYWHFDPLNNLVIDDIHAQSTNIAMGINQNGVDYGALTPFLSGEKGKSSVQLNAIRLDNLKLALNSPKGDINFEGKLFGDFDKELTGNFFVFAPQFYQSKSPVSFDILAQRPLQNPVSLKLHLKGENLTPNPNLLGGAKIANFSPNLNADIGYENNSKNLNLKITNSNITLSGLRIGETIINGININNTEVDFGAGKELFTDNQISARGNLALSSARIAQNKISSLAGDFEIARTRNGNTRLYFNGKANGFSAGVNANAASLKGYAQGSVQDIRNLLNAPITGEFDAGLLGANLAKFVPQDVIAKSNIGALLNNANLSGRLAFAKDAQKFNFALKSPIELTSSEGRLRFMPTGGEGQNNIHFDQYLSAQLSGALVSTGNFAPKINARSFNLFYSPQTINIRSNDLNAQKVIYNGFGFDTKLNDFYFAQNGKNAPQLSAVGRSVINSKNNQGAANFIASINGSRIDIRGSAAIGELDYFGATASDTNIAGSISGLAGKALTIKANGNSANFKFGNLSLANSKINVDGILTAQKQANFSGKVDLSSAKFSGDKIAAHDLNLHLMGATNIESGRLFAGHINANSMDFAANETNIEAPAIDGEIRLDTKGNNIALTAPSCLKLAFDKLAAGDTRIAKTGGRLCPDGAGRILAINSNKLALYANTDFDQTEIKLGTNADSPKFAVKNLSGKFYPSTNGGLNFIGNSGNLDFEFAISPNQSAKILTQNTNLELSEIGSKTVIKAKIEKLIGENLPVDLEGGLSGELSIIEGQKPIADFDLKSLIVKDKNPSPSFKPLIINGRGQLRDDKINIFGNAGIETHLAPLADLYLEHNLTSGKGQVLLDASKLTFIPATGGNDGEKLEAADILPPLKGIFNDTRGILDTRAGISWAPNSPLKSYARLVTEDLEFTPPFGAVKGIKGNVEISDLLNLKTDKQQLLNVRLFDPGLPIEDGQLGFELAGNNSIDINLIKWKFADGTLNLRPINIPFGKMPKDIVIDAKDVDIAKLLLLAKIPNLEVEGLMSGTLPIKIVDNGFEIVGGHLFGEKDGVLRYTGPDIIPPKPPAKGFAKLQEMLFGKKPDIQEIAFNALRDLHYRVLQIDVDGKIEGDMVFGILLEGSNPQILENHPIRFKIKANIPVGELRANFDNIFTSSDQFVTDQVLKKMQEEKQ